MNKAHNKSQTVGRVSPIGRNPTDRSQVVASGHENVGLRCANPTYEADWQTTTLGEVSTWMSGGTPKKDVIAYWNGVIPWISANSMYGTRYSDSNLRISQEGLEKGSRLAPKNSILLLVRGGALHNRIPVGIATRDVAFNQDVKALIAKKTILNPWFLLFWVMGHERFLLDSVVEYTGIGAGKLDTKRMQGLEFLLPSLAEQEAIVSVVKAIDDRITLLLETNTTLQAIAQALFKSWFVEFDPVRAKQQGREPEGMDSTTAALFPDSFEESELGLAPSGWRVAPVGDVIEIVGGGTPNTKEAEYWEPAEFAWTTPKDLSGLKSPVLLKTERLLSAKGVSKVSSGLLPIGTLLLSSRAPIGYLAIAQIPLAINQGYIAILPSSQLPPLYMYFWCKQNMDVIKSRSNGSTFMEISKKAFRPIPALVPPVELFANFLDVANPIFARLAENEKQAQSLATLRDTLLPRLISGQLHLPEASPSLV